MQVIQFKSQYKVGALKIQRKGTLSLTIPEKSESHPKRLAHLSS